MLLGHLYPETGAAMKPLDHGFMSEARALTHLIGNGVATLVVARWTGDPDTVRLQRQLDSETQDEADASEAVLDKVDQHLQIRSGV